MLTEGSRFVTAAFCNLYIGVPGDCMLYYYVPDYDEKIYGGAVWEKSDKRSFYYFTRCPLNDFAREYGYIEVLPVCCELDYILTEASHGKLIREYTLAEGGPICDYWIVPDKMKNPQ